MPDDAAQGRLNIPLNRLLPVVLLAGGAANGFAVRIFETWRDTGLSSLFFGVSPFEFVVVAIAVSLVLHRGQAPKDLRWWPEVLLLIGLMVPSSTVSWMCVGLYAGYLAWSGRGDFRYGAMLVMALAGASLWSSIALRWFAVPITSFEANVIWLGLQLFRGDLSVNGNVVGIPGGHEVIILAACSSAFIVPKALLAVVAIAVLFRELSRNLLVGLAAFVAISLTLANWVRLAAMVWSADMFAIAHGPVGANIFDVVQSSLILAIGYVLCNRSNYAPQPSLQS